MLRNINIHLKGWGQCMLWFLVDRCWSSRDRFEICWPDCVLSVTEWDVALGYRKTARLHLCHWCAQNGDRGICIYGETSIHELYLPLWYQSSKLSYKSRLIYGYYFITPYLWAFIGPFLFVWYSFFLIVNSILMWRKCFLLAFSFFLLPLGQLAKDPL